MIILDLDMPKMSGLELMEALERLPLDREKLFVVMLTASLDPEDRRRAMQSSFKLDGYHVKPLSYTVMEELTASMALKR